MKGCGTSPKRYFGKHFDKTSHGGIKKKRTSDLRQLQCDSSALGNHFQPVQWCSFTGNGTRVQKRSVRQNKAFSEAKPLLKVKAGEEAAWQHEL